MGGCFRDDIVFFIMLYQRYIYREDPSRLNEFGFSAEMLAQKELEKQNNGTPAAIEGDETVDDENAEKETEDADNVREGTGTKSASKKKQKQKSSKAKKID